MFGFFKKKPTNALEELIFKVYGNPPPPKTAKLEQAIDLAFDELLMEIIDREDVTSFATSLDNGPFPYSTHDLAICVALKFFKDPSLVPRLKDAQMLARMNAMEWFVEKKVNPIVMKNFEDNLYELYKPVH